MPDQEDIEEVKAALAAMIPDECQAAVLATLEENGDLSAFHIAHEQGTPDASGCGARRVRSALLHLQQRRLVTQVDVDEWSITRAGRSELFWPT